MMIGAFDSGSLEETSASVLDAALDKFIVSTAVAISNLSVAAPRSADRRAAGAAAVNLAKVARGIDDDINEKISTAIAAGYSASFFGLPQNSLLDTVDQICGMFALTANQRRALHQQAAAILQDYVTSLKKGNAMSGILQNGSFRDGSLGVLVSQQRATRDGVLGRIVAQQRAFSDGSLGAIMAQAGAFRAGSLGIMPPPQFPVRDGVLGASYLSDKWQAMMRNQPWVPQSPGVPSARQKRRAATAGLGGGCGCSGGMGADVAVVETPFYQKPLVIGGAAVALGVVLYAVTRK